MHLQASAEGMSTPKRRILKQRLVHKRFFFPLSYCAGTRLQGEILVPFLSQGFSVLVAVDNTMSHVTFHEHKLKCSIPPARVVAWDGV